MDSTVARLVDREDKEEELERNRAHWSVRGAGDEIFHLNGSCIPSCGVASSPGEDTCVLQGATIIMHELTI